MGVGSFAAKDVIADAYSAYVVLLPARPLITDFYNIQRAIDISGKRKFIAYIGVDIVRNIRLDAFSIYEFDSKIFMSNLGGRIWNEENSEGIVWDEFQEYVAVAGSMEFCSTVSPYPVEIQQHYFLEAFDPDRNKDAQDLWRELTRPWIDKS